MIENEIFWYIVNFMATTIEELVLVKIFDIYSKRKQNTSIVYSLIFIPIIMVQIFDFYGLDSNIKMAIILLIDFIYCMYCYENKVLKTILLSGLYWMISMGMDLLAFSVVNVLNSNSNATIMMNFNFYRLELIGFSKFMLVMSVVALKKLNIKSELSIKQVYLFQ